MSEKAPAGVVAIYTDPDGIVIESVADFDRSGYGGFTLLQGQEMRARRELAYAVMRAYCSDRVWDALKDRATDMLSRLERGGGMVTLISIGHEADP